MTTKIKTISAIIATGIVIIGVFAFYQFKNGANREIINDAVDQQQVETGTTIPKTEVVTQVSSGVVTSINEKIFEVKIESGNFNLNVQDNTAVYSIVKGARVQKSIGDVKVGSKIMFEYDEKTNNALAIKVIQ